MKKKHKLVLALLMTCCIGIGLIFLSKTAYVATPTARAPKANSESFKTPYHRLDSAARAAKDGSPNSIEALADAVIEDFIPLTLPSDSRAAIRARLVRSQLSYMKGGPGVSELDIVRTVNDLADRFAAPEYVKTSPAQVRFLRATMIGPLAHLIVRQPITDKRGPKKQHSSLHHELSPIEAVFLTTLLIQQKVLNEDFQIEPKEWPDYKHKKDVERWQSFHERKGTVGASSGVELSVRPANPKADEINDLIQRNSNVSQSDLVNLMARSLDMLGISQ